MIDREEDVDQDAQNCKLCRVIVNSKYRKTSNKSRVSSTTWVSIWCQLMTLVVVLYGIIMTKSLAMGTPYRIRVTKQTVSKVKGFVVYAITHTFICRKSLKWQIGNV